MVVILIYIDKNNPINGVIIRDPLESVVCDSECRNHIGNISMSKPIWSLKQSECCKPIRCRLCQLLPLIPTPVTYLLPCVVVVAVDFLGESVKASHNTDGLYTHLPTGSQCAGRRLLHDAHIQRAYLPVF